MTLVTLQTRIIEAEHYARGSVSVPSKEGKKKISFEGTIQTILILLPSQVFKCLTFEGFVHLTQGSRSIRAIALQPVHDNLPLRISQRNLPEEKTIPEKTVLSVQDDEFSDWEILDAGKIEAHIEACLAAAKLNEGKLEEDWVHLDHDKLDKDHCSYVEMLRKECNFSGNPNIIDYIIPYFSSLLPGSVNVAFEEGRMIVQDGPFVQKTSARILQLLLAETYGPVMAWTLMNRYQLINKPSITLEDVKKVFVGVAANTKISDLKDLWRDLRKDKNSRQLHCLKLLSDAEIQELQDVQGLEALNARQIGTLLKAFQTLPYNSGYSSMMEILFQGCPRGLALWEFDCFNHDTEVCARLPYIDSADQEHLELSISEHMCKNIMYLELKDGAVIPMLTSSRQRIYYYVANKLKDNKDGVICSLLAPINLVQEVYSKDNPLVIHVVFRGTQWQPGRKDSTESLQRDLDNSGIGRTSFNARERELVDMLILYLKSVDIPWVKIVLSGHSLGGTDTKRKLRLLTKQLSQAPQHKELAKIVAIAAYCHNSPAPEAELNKLFAEDLKLLEAQNRDISIDITLILFDTDVLQNSGDMYLGAQIKSRLLKKFAVLAESKKYKYFSAHRLKAFVEPKDECRLKFIDADTPDDQLEKIYSRNFYWNIENNTWIERTGKRIHWYGGYAIKPMTRVIFGSLYYGFSLINVFSRSVGLQRSDEVKQRGWRKKTISVDPSHY